MLPNTLFAFFWYFVRPYRLILAGMIFSAFVYAILVSLSLSPYLLKIIIDSVVALQHNHGDVYQGLILPGTMFVILYQAMDLCWGMVDYLKSISLPKVRADVVNAMFSHLQGHSYNYFFTRI
jgi:ATP-binding cassette, subfamily B, bacterial